MRVRSEITRYLTQDLTGIVDEDISVPVGATTLLKMGRPVTGVISPPPIFGQYPSHLSSNVR